MCDSGSVAEKQVFHILSNNANKFINSWLNPHLCTTPPAKAVSCKLQAYIWSASNIQHIKVRMDYILL